MRNDPIEKLKGGLILIWVLVTVGTIFLIGSDISRLSRLSGCTETVTATAEAPNKRETMPGTKRIGGKATYYTPVFTYEYRGQTYHAAYSESWEKNPYPRGTVMEIQIDPNDPEVIRIPDETKRKDALGNHLLIFLMFCVFPLVLFLLVTRNSRVHDFLFHRPEPTIEQFRALEAEIRMKEEMKQREEEF